MAKQEDRKESVNMDALQSSPQGFTGTVNLQLTDLFQMVCLCRSDLVIRVRSGESDGTIYVKTGQVCHAQTEYLQGESAFFQMFQWKDGQFEMLPYKDPGVNSIDKPWEHLLLEAMRLKDEGAGANGVPAAEEARKESPSEDQEKLEMDQNIDLVFDELEEISKEFSLQQEALDLPTEAARPTRVLIVDDSSFFARQLKKMMEADSQVQVAAIAKNGKEALDYLAGDTDIDLITLDVQMPVMQGDTTLKHIMIRYPIPVLIISSFESQSIQKIFEFLQVGAVDFFSKPTADEDMTRYSESLRDLVRDASKADVSRFRRWRKPNTPAQSFSDPDPWRKQLLMILGAEGAYMDWFRLPLDHLCQKGLVVGLQKLSDPYLPGFCELIRNRTRAKTEQLRHSGWINPGSFHFGNACSPVDMDLDLDSMSLNVQRNSDKRLAWQEGVHHWLDYLAERAQSKMSVYLLSASHALPPGLVEKLLTSGARLIMSPRDMAMCAELIDSVQAYVTRYPQQISWASHDDFMGSWLQK